MPTYSDTRHIQTEIPRELHRKLKGFCVEKEVTLTTLLSQIVTMWINKNVTPKEVKDGEEKNDKRD
jgi:hypothetical protein